MALSPEDQAELDAIRAEKARRAAASASAPGPSVTITPEAQAELAAIRAEKMRRGQAAADPMAAAAVPTAGASVAPGVAAISALAAPVAVPAAATAAGIKKAVNPEGSAEGIKDEYEQLPDWMWMPEFGPLASPRAFAGTLAPGQAEVKKIMEARFPGMKVESDGRYLIMTSQDGQKYAWKPGMRWSDLARAAAGMAAAAPVSMMVAPGIAGGIAAGGLTALGNEVAQHSAGGDFNEEQILAGMALGGAVPAGAAAKRAITGEGSAAAAARAAANASGMTLEEGAATLGRASQGSAVDRAAMQGFVDVDKGLLAAADDIGARGFVDPLVATKNPVAREVLKSAGAVGEDGKILGELFDERTRGFVNHVRGLFSEWGASASSGTADASVRERLGAGVRAFRAVTQRAYEAVKSGMPDESPAVARRTLEYLRGRIGKVRPDSPLAEVERTIVAELGNPTAGGLAMLQDSLDLAAKGQGVLAGIHKNVATKIKGMVADDLVETAEKYGQKEALLAARELSKQENALKRAATSRFGKAFERTLEGSGVNKSGRAIDAAIAGDAAPLLKFYNDLPANLRADAVVDSFAQVIQKAGDLKSLVGLFDAVESNPQLQGLVTSTMKPEARQGLKSVITVARGFANAAAAPTSPGRYKSALPSVKPGVSEVLSDKAFGHTKGWLGKSLDTNKLSRAARFLVDEAASLVEGRTPAPNVFRRLMDGLDVPPSERGVWFKAIRAAPVATPNRDKEK